MQVYAHIKDEVTNFFHEQGITIVTIQPEFKHQDASSQSKSSLSQCLIGCQSVECAPKTCCSLNELDSIVTNGDGKPKEQRYRKAKGSKATGSLLSLNVSSLAKFRKSALAGGDGMKKSVSETHVGHAASDSELTACPSTHAIHSEPAEPAEPTEAVAEADPPTYSEVITHSVVEAINEQNETEAEKLNAGNSSASDAPDKAATAEQRSNENNTSNTDD